MNISPTSVSFKATLSGQTYWKHNRLTRKAELTETKFSEMVKSYDEQIAKIQKQKAKAIELDTFMRTDKDVQEAVKKLPKEDRIEMVNNFNGEIVGDNATIEMEDLSLLYNSEKFVEEYGNDGTLLFVQDEKGEIDKKGIINWLNELVDLVCKK